MRDAMGGTVTITIVVVFIVFALSYMAFNVNYTKAFRMKDKIISLYDDYDGNCEMECQEKIRKYADKVGYSGGAATGASAVCPKDGDYHADGTNTYCYVEKDLGEGADGKERKYYKVATRITIDFPLFRNILNYNVFYVFGDTKTYKYDPN